MGIECVDVMVDKLSVIGVLMLIMWGCDDNLVLVFSVQKFVDVILGLIQVIYDGVGYLLQEEYVVQFIVDVCIFMFEVEWSVLDEEEIVLVGDFCMGENCLDGEE